MRAPMKHGLLPKNAYDYSNDEDLFPRRPRKEAPLSAWLVEA